MAASSSSVAHQFDDLEQQHEADTMGMWAFLLTEVLLFGGLFMGYAVYRSLYPESWAEGSHHNDLLLGTINTTLLLASSLTVALAVHYARAANRRRVLGLLAGTIALGVCFLGIKFFEYYVHFEHGLVPGASFHLDSPHVELFFVFYFAATSLHALHMIIGIGLLGFVAAKVRSRPPIDHVTVEMIGLYWHLIDIVWVFLYPLFYLVG